jgi:hypothetical protein
MNLFINAISKNAYIALFDDKRNILSSKFFEVKWNESSLFISILDEFLKENKLTYLDLENIVIVNWPWSFTWVRTIVLAINTIAFVVNSNKDISSTSQEKTKQKLYLTPISYFDLYNSYPVIKSSSKKDSFFKKEKNSPIKIIYNDELENILKNENIKTIYGEWDIKNIEIIEKINYVNIIRNIKFKKYSKIEALYIKKPNIC